MAKLSSHQNLIKIFINILVEGAQTDSIQVDPAKLNTLKELIAGPDYKENMQKIIRTIYEFAFMTYAGVEKQTIENTDIKNRYLLWLFRPAAWSDQEQLDEEARVQDLDGDSPPWDRGDGQSEENILGYLDKYNLKCGQI